MTRREPAPAVYRFLVTVLRSMTRALRWRVHLEGLENIPATGPVIVVANHNSYVDPILLGLGVEQRGRTVRYLAKRELFDHWFTGPAMRRAGQIPVDRRGDAGAALRHAEEAMRQAQLLVIFPEATIHATFDPRTGKTGAARLALGCGAPLIPAVAWGGQAVSTKQGRRGLGHGSVHEVRFGPAIPYTRDDAVSDLTRRLMEEIAALLVAAAAAHPQDLGQPVVAEA